ncbi:MAG: flagellar biosynthesis anti-sigma factor FlgM [Lachnospiraceae bacterium]
MRIDAYNQVSQLYKANKASKAEKTYKKSMMPALDEVQISQTGRDYQIAKQAVAAAGDIRGDKVTKLKENIASGNYKVDADDFASKLLEKYNALL